MIIAYTRSSNIYDDSRATKEILAFIEAGYKVIVYGWNRDGRALYECEKLFESYKDRLLLHFFEGNQGSGVFGKIFARYQWNKWLKKKLLLNPEIAVIHSCDYDTGSAVKTVSKKRNIEYIYDIFDYYVDAHPVPRILQHFVEKKEVQVINSACATIICTEERREQIKNARPKKLAIIHNSPDVAKIEEVPVKYDYAYCGSLYGYRLIEEILNKYQDHKQLKFVFAGTGPLEEELNSIPNIENVGFKSGEELEKLIREARFSIYPSEWYENCPFSVMESQMYGTPVLGARIGGIPELIKEGETGELFESGNAEELKEKISELYNDKAKTDRYSDNCKNVDFDTIEEYYQKILNYY